MPQSPFDIIFMGTPEIALPSLEFLHQSSYCALRNVVSMPDRPKGRGKKIQSPPVAEFAQKHNLPLFQTENINLEKKWLAQFSQSPPDLIIVFAFAQFLSKEILSLSKYGAYNLHTSLLPKYRGASPIHQSLLNGDSVTGISLQKMVSKMDAGPLFSSRTLPVLEDDNYSSLYTKLGRAAPLLLQDFLLALSKGPAVLTPQDESQVSYAPIIKKEDSLLNFFELPSYEVLNRIRAYSSWPIATFRWKEEILKTCLARLSCRKLSPGEIKDCDGELHVGCADEKSVRLLSVQRPNRKMMKDTELLKGKSG